MSSIQRVGYIGMGIMGSAMAANLLKAGFSVSVWNRTRSKCEPLESAGASVCESPAAMAEEGPDVIFINVSDTPDVEHVVFGDGGVAESAKSGLIIVDHSTISPAATQRFAAQLAERGITWIDAPVSGGDVGAREGTLSIMVGGPADAVVRCMSAFEAMGRSIKHLGPAGSGQICKACNQIAVTCTLMGVCEAIELARRSGLDVAGMIDVVSGGAGGSWQLANLGPKVMNNDLAPGFMIDLLLKDLAIVFGEATAHGLKLNGTAAAETYLKRVASDGGGQLGTQAMCKAVQESS